MVRILLEVGSVRARLLESTPGIAQSVAVIDLRS